MLPVSHCTSRFPHPLLKPFIDRFWGWDCPLGEVVALPLVLPGTGIELLFHHGAPFRRILAGDPDTLPQNHTLCVRHRALSLVPAAGTGFVAVRFRAGQLGQFTALPLVECIDQPLPVDALWGIRGRDLAARVEAAGDFQRRVDLIEQFLLRQLDLRQPDRLVSSAAHHLYHQTARITVDQLAAQLDIGRRQLEKRFLRVEGITPAAFRRRARFQKTVRQLMLNPSDSLIEAALEHGYYDQSHFCRDFKDLAGRSPASHLAAARGVTHFYNTPRP